MYHVQVVDKQGAQAALLTSTLQTREACTFAPDFVCPLPSVDKFRWAVHVVGMRRHHFLECVTGGGGAFGAMAAIAEAVSMY